MASIKRSVKESLPVGVQSISPNGREYTSHFYLISKKTKKFVRADKAPARYYALVTILGDMRPYTVKVTVHSEKRVNSSTVVPEYSHRGIDKAQSKYIAKRIANHLSKRRKDVNIIDDFRIF